MWIRKRENILKLIVILTVVNLAALGTMFYNLNKPETKPPQERRAHTIFQKELELDSTQQMDFDQLYRIFREQSKDIIGEIKETKREMYKELIKADPDTVKLEQIALELGELQVILKRTTYKHFLELRSICKPEQYDKLNRMYRRMLDRNSCQKPERDHRHRHGKRHKRDRNNN